MISLLFAIPIAVMVALLISRVNAWRLRRIQALVPREFVILFQSNLWFQNAVLKMRSEGVIDPETKTDSEDPVGGPRWASASSEGLAFWRGYGTAPFFRLPWSKVSDISRQANTVPSTSSRTSSWGIGVTVHGREQPIHLFLEQPFGIQKSGFRSSAYVDLLVTELNERRGAEKESSA